MLERIRYFVEDLSVTAIAAIAGVIGLALGVMGTTQLAAGNLLPDDVDSVAVEQVALPAPVAQEPDTSGLDAEIGRLEEKITDLRALLADEREAAEEREARIDAVTARVQRIAAARGALQRKLEKLADAPTTATVSGVLVTSTTLSLEQKPWPATCAGVASSFQVRVSTGGATVFIAEPTAGEVTEREVGEESLSIGCRFTYEATLPMPLAKSYDFAAVASLEPRQALDTGSADTGTIKDGDAPQLSASS